MFDLKHPVSLECPAVSDLNPGSWTLMSGDALRLQARIVCNSAAERVFRTAYISVAAGKSGKTFPTAFHAFC